MMTYTYSSIKNLLLIKDNNFMKELLIEANTDLTKRNLTYGSIIKNLFSQSIELLPSVNELFELELAYLEFLSLTKEDLLERSAYIMAIEDEFTKHYLMYKQRLDGLINNRSTQTRNYFEEGKFSTGYATHGLFPYRGKFHPQLIKAIINIIGIKKGETILDPMCGSGTTNIEASLMGINSYAVDVSPFCRFMTDVKYESLFIDIQRLKGIHLKIDKLFPYFSKKTQFPFLQIDDKEKIKIYKLALLAFLDALGYSKRVSKSGHKELFQKVIYRYEATVSDFIMQNEAYLKKLGNVEILTNASATDLPLADNSIDGVITSPPYSFAIDYLQNDKSQLEYFGFDIENLRPKMIGLRGKNINEKLDYYFYDMDIVCSEISRVLKKGKYMVMIIGSNTNQTKGVHLEEKIIEICNHHTLILIRVILKPIRGMRNTMKDEYILFFQKS